MDEKQFPSSSNDQLTLDENIEMKAKHSVTRWVNVSLCWLVVTLSTSLAQTEFVPFGSSWKYLDNGTDQGTAWRQGGFNDSGWAQGPAQLGYGDGDEATVVGFGPDANNKFITTYFRQSFNVADASAVAALALEIVRDDGAVVYLNGTEVFRTNMPGGSFTYTTTASSAVGGASESAIHTTSLNPALLVTGSNQLAVEIHQSSGTSSDISFNLRLSEPIQGVSRGPYLQRASASQVTVRWRTDVATDSVVNYGTDSGNLNQTAQDPTSSTEHGVTVTGLLPNTTYYYSVGDSSTTFAQGPDFFFETHPSPGTGQATRIWVLGDSGTADANAAAVRDAFLGFNGGSHVDLWLMLGDNAYNDGTDAEYQAAVFDMYPTILRNSVLWSTLGNHDGHTADSATQSGPYYDIFTLPAAGESGGIASGTEAYYSFDYANIHFVCLDSYETDRSSGGAMATWLQSDLAATTQEWIVAFWHHPPYSKGSHNSDTEGRLIDMRQVFLPIFESHGVDLVLGGHSHSYERSMLIDGHYGDSSTFGPANIIDGGDGDPAGSGGYVKETIPNDGAVYITAGSSGKISGGALNHPVMISNLNQLGSVVVDVNFNQMDVQFLNNAGVVSDTFRITHDPGPGNPPAAPSGLSAAPFSPSEIDLNWTDNASDEDGFDIERSPDGSLWALIDSVGADSVSYRDSGLNDDTTYHYRVAAFNGAGSSPYSNSASATTDPAPPFIDQVASSESNVFGTVSGTFQDTHADDAVAESITETESGGKPSKRRSRLEHSWEIVVQSGNVITLFANAWSSGSADNDEFQFDFSLNGGSSWMPAFTVSSTSSGNFQSAGLPSSASGSVLVRVTDTDRTQGNRALDTVFVDELFIRTETVPGDPPAAPSGLSAAAEAAGLVQLAWTVNAGDELGFEVQRMVVGGNWAFLANAAADAQSFDDDGVTPNTSYNYRVRAYNSSGSSDWSNEAGATTPNGIALAANGYKVKGVHTIDLTWSNATTGNCDIYRDGVLVATVPNTGSYTDSTGAKGGATYTYQVCEEGSTTACSNTVLVTF